MWRAEVTGATILTMPQLFYARALLSDCVDGGKGQVLEEVVELLILEFTGCRLH